MQWGVKSIKWVIFHFFIEAVSPCASETKTKTFPKTVATVVVPVHTQTHTGVCDVQISSFEMSELRLPKKPISRIFYCCNFAVCWLCLLLFSLLASSLSVPWLADQSSLLHIQFSSTLTVNEKWEPGFWRTTTQLHLCTAWLVSRSCFIFLRQQPVWDFFSFEAAWIKRWLEWVCKLASTPFRF